jgi:broad specificity phosphatase PhoE
MAASQETRTVLYLIRDGATEASVAQPARLQGRRHNPPLTRLGVRQAEATRDFLAVRPVDHCYCSPMLRALQTAAIVAAPHGLSPQPLDGLVECDVGRWEGLDWPTVRYLDAEGYQRFATDPARHGFPGGESYVRVWERVVPVVEDLFRRHQGQSILVVAHHIVNQVYLGHLLGLDPVQAQQVRLDPCGISVVVLQGDEATVATLNAAFHLQGVAA